MERDGATAQHVATSAPAEPERPEPPPPAAPQEASGPDARGAMDESLDKEFQFASLEGSEVVDEDVGRVIDFEESKVEQKEDSPDGQFIVNPFQSEEVESEEQDSVEEPPRAPAAASPPPQPQPSAGQDDDSVTVTVPVYLKRSQMRKTVPIKIELEILLGDEDS